MINEIVCYPTEGAGFNWNQFTRAAHWTEHLELKELIWTNFPSKLQSSSFYFGDTLYVSPDRRSARKSGPGARHLSPHRKTTMEEEKKKESPGRIQDIDIGLGRAANHPKSVQWRTSTHVRAAAAVSRFFGSRCAFSPPYRWGRSRSGTHEIDDRRPV